jgi:hypothetical protein
MGLMRALLKYSALVAVVALLAACDKVPLLAPNGSTISLSANATTVPAGGTVGLTAFVSESSGTPVQNGTSVRFTTTLGTVTPADAQTTNGLAVATFQAGNGSGVAEIHAISGAAGGTTGTGATATTANVVKITVGVAAVKTVTVTSTPTSVGPNGGAVTVAATVVDPNGASLPGIPVTFSADHGSVNPGTATTDSSGTATTTLSTGVETKVTATAGTVSGTATVTLRSGPGVTLDCAPATGTGSCAAIAASDSSNTATVTFTVAKATSSSPLRDVTLDFGDGTSQGLGTLSGGSVKVSHTYNATSGSTASYTATARATDAEGERSNASAQVNVTPRAALVVDLKATKQTAVSGVGQQVDFEATVTGGTGQSFAWDFDGDGSVDATTSSNKTSHVYRENGQKTAIVTVTTIDNRNATGRTEFIISGI